MLNTGKGGKAGDKSQGKERNPAPIVKKISKHEEKDG